MTTSALFSELDVGLSALSFRPIASPTTAAPTMLAEAICFQRLLVIVLLRKLVERLLRFAGTRAIEGIGVEFYRQSKKIERRVQMWEEKKGGARCERDRERL